MSYFYGMPVTCFDNNYHDGNSNKKKKVTVVFFMS